MGVYRMRCVRTTHWIASVQLSCVRAIAWVRCLRADTLHRCLARECVHAKGCIQMNKGKCVAREYVRANALRANACNRFYFCLFLFGE